MEWTPPDVRNQFIDSFATALERATTILYREYLTMPDLTSQQIDKHLSKSYPPIMIL